MLLNFYLPFLLLLILFPLSTSKIFSSYKYPPYDTYDTLLEPHNIYFSKQCSNYSKNTSFEIWTISNDTAYVGYSLDFILVSNLDENLTIKTNCSINKEFYPIIYCYTIEDISPEFVGNISLKKIENEIKFIPNDTKHTNIMNGIDLFDVVAENYSPDFFNNTNDFIEYEFDLDDEIINHFNIKFDVSPKFLPKFYSIQFGNKTNKHEIKCNFKIDDNTEVECEITKEFFPIVIPNYQYSWYNISYIDACGFEIDSKITIMVRPKIKEIFEIKVEKIIFNNICSKYNTINEKILTLKTNSNNNIISQSHFKYNLTLISFFESKDELNISCKIENISIDPDINCYLIERTYNKTLPSPLHLKPLNYNMDVVLLSDYDELKIAQVLPFNFDINSTFYNENYTAPIKLHTKEEFYFNLTDDYINDKNNDNNVFNIQFDNKVFGKQYFIVKAKSENDTIKLLECNGSLSDFPDKVLCNVNKNVFNVNETYPYYNKSYSVYFINICGQIELTYATVNVFSNYFNNNIFYLKFKSLFYLLFVFLL